MQDQRSGGETSEGGAAQPDGHGGMGSRGVTRPMAGSIRAKQAPGRERGEGHGAGGGGAMTPEDRAAMLASHHAQTLWVPWTVILLGVWMILAPLTFGYGPASTPPGGRELWLAPEQRVAAATWSDLVSGVLLVLFGWRWLRPERLVSAWAACFVGIWLQLAPVALWAPTSAVYLNDTVVGTLVIALTVLIPGMPGMIRYMKMGPDTPPGWTYNPSSWPQRWILVALGFAGFLASRYLAAYQLGYLDGVWDPFFGDGTRRVLESEMSRALPVSDAALGTLAYTFEFLMAFMGGPARWRTMPWMVTLFGILVIPLGLVHVFLVISQPVAVGAWCTWCLLAAALMLPMIPLEGDEVVAMGQHVLQARRRGERVWKVFWKGGSPEGATPDRRSPALVELPARPGAVLRASVWGLSVTWGLVGSALVGIGLMAAPGILGIAKPAANVHHLGGALLVTFSVIAMGEVFRVLRWTAVLLGAVVAIAPFLLDGASTAARLAGAVAGGAAAALAIPRGPKRERYGGWDRVVV